MVWVANEPENLFFCFSREQFLPWGDTPGVASRPRGSKGVDLGRHLSVDGGGERFAFGLSIENRVPRQGQPIYVRAFHRHVHIEANGVRQTTVFGPPLIMCRGAIWSCLLSFHRRRSAAHSHAWYHWCCWIPWNRGLVPREDSTIRFDPSGCGPAGSSQTGVALDVCRRLISVQ